MGLEWVWSNSNSNSKVAMCQNVNSPGGQLSPLEEMAWICIIQCCGNNSMQGREREREIMKWDGIHGMYMELGFNFMCVWSGGEIGS